jgi:AraC-like DNA-binding protein
VVTAERADDPAAEPAEPAEPRVSGVLVRALADVLVRRGIPPQEVIPHDGGRFPYCEPLDVRLPLRGYLQILQRAIARSGDPALALHAALDAHDSAFDMMAPLVAHLPSLRHALQEASRFSALVFEGAFLHMSEHTGTACLRLELPRVHDDGDRTLAEFVTAGLSRMLAAFGCTQRDIVAVHFEHRCPPHQASYAAAFFGKERFGEPFTGIELACAALDRPHLHNNPALQALMRAQAEQRLERLSRTQSPVERLRTYLRNQPIGRVPEMPVAARELRTSVRSLRRRLAERGCSYRELVQEAQREQACVLLRNPELTLQGVAHELGFADMSAFHRAFKRWTGVTAMEYRHAH